MFCPSCGTEYAIGLPYCNRCGANLNSPLGESSETVIVNLTKPTLIISLTLMVFTLIGFTAVISGAIALSRSVQLGTDPVVATIVLGMLTIMTTDFFLARQLSKLITASLKPGATKQTRKSMPPANVAQLPRPITSQLSPAPSVTENTTRFFEPAYRPPGEDPSPRKS